MLTHSKKNSRLEYLLHEVFFKVSFWIFTSEENKIQIEYVQLLFIKICVEKSSTLHLSRVFSVWALKKWIIEINKLNKESSNPSNKLLTYSLRAMHEFANNRKKTFCRTMEAGEEEHMKETAKWCSTNVLIRWSKFILCIVLVYSRWLIISSEGSQLISISIWRTVGNFSCECLYK